MKIRIVSDLHNEINRTDFFAPNSKFVPVPYEDDEYETTLIIAGDLGTVKEMDKTIRPYIEEWSNRFEHVIYVPGNHEFYGMELFRGDFELKKLLGKFDNVHYSGLFGQVKLIDDTRFVLTPLFCDADRDPVNALLVKQGLADFQMIRMREPEGRGERYIDTRDYSSFFEDACYFIRMSVTTNPRKTVVVTHWTPSYQSVPERFKGSPINGGFSSDLDEMIMDLKPAVWIHGHTHDAFDYTIGETRVLCNPYGYAHEGDTGFNPHLAVNV